MLATDILRKRLLGNVVEADEVIDAGSNERFSLFQDYLGLSNLLSTVKISDDNPLMYSSAFLQQRARRGSYGSDGSDSTAVLSPTMESQYSYEKAMDGNNNISSLVASIGRNAKRDLPSPTAKPILTLPPAISSRTNQSVQVCVFCRNNGEIESVYTNHVLKDPEGRTSCPILRAYTCPICKANGDNSHTIKYCPLNQNARLMMSQQHHTNSQPPNTMNFVPRSQHSLPPARPNNGFRSPFPSNNIHGNQRYYQGGKPRL